MELRKVKSVGLNRYHLREVKGAIKSLELHGYSDASNSAYPAAVYLYFDYSSAEYRVIAIILDIANFRLFRPVRSDVPAEKPKHIMKIKFFNKVVDAINLPALLRSTSVTNKIRVYFRDKEPPIVSYEYTSTVASKLLTLHQPFQI